MALAIRSQRINKTAFAKAMILLTARGSVAHEQKMQGRFSGPWCKGQEVKVSL